MNSPPDPERVNEIFNNALELSPGERQAYLEAECGDDAALRDEVLSLLDKNSAAEEWFPTQTLNLAPTFAVGELVAKRYRIVRMLGRGGMGEVYEAADGEMGDHVALKTIRAGIAAEEGVLSRFRQEIQLGRRIAHPNVCDIYNIDKHGSVYFYSMELLHGQTLAQRLRSRRRFTTLEALPLLTQMAEALAAAHEAGIIHRDFKPGNVMLLDGNPRRSAVVTDFGLARLVQTGERSAITGLGHFAGTPAYMAPEQLEEGPLTAATDIYALGLVAYEMVSGRRPFEGSSEFSAAVRRMTGNPVPLTKHVPEINPRWNAAIMKCLERDPADRFASARDFIEALTGTAPGSVGTVTLKLPRFARSAANRWLWLGLAAAAVVTTAAVMLRRSPADNVPPDAKDWLEKGVTAVRDGVYWKATTDLSKAIEIYGDLPVAFARRAEAWNEMDSPDRAAADMAKAHAHPSGLSDTNRRYVEAINFTVAGEFQAAVNEYREILDRLPRDQKHFGRLDLGRAYEKNAEPGKALQQYEAAIADRPNWPGAWLRKGVLERKTLRPEDAQKDLQKALDLFREEGDAEGQAQAEFELARLKTPAEAEPLLADALQLARLNSYQQIIIKLQQSYVAVQKADLTRAEQLAAEANDLANSQHMPVLAARCLNDMGNTLFRAERLPEAEKYFRDAITLASRYSAELQENAARLNLADLLERKSDEGQREEGRQDAQIARTYFSKHQYRFETAAADQVLAKYEIDRGNYKESTEALLRAKSETDNPATIAYITYELGFANVSAEHYPEAIKQLQAAREMHKRLGILSYLKYDDEALASAFAEVGDIKSARASVANAQSEGAQAVDIVLNEMEIDMIEGDCKRASKTADSLLQKASTDPETLLQATGTKCVCAARAGKLSAALRFGEQSVKEQVQNRTAQSSAKLAFAFAQMLSGDLNSAKSTLEPLEKDMRHDGRLASLWRCQLYLARTWDSLGDASKSQEWVQSASTTLDTLKKNWGADYARSYESRIDLRSDFALLRTLQSPVVEPRKRG